MDIDFEGKNRLMKKTNKIYSIYHTIKKPYIISKAEARIKNDLNAIKNKRLIKNRFKINISPYSQCENQKDFIMFIEFENLFKIQIIFLEDYPFVPPNVTYVSGQYLEHLFDNLGKFDNKKNLSHSYSMKNIKPILYNIITPKDLLNKYEKIVN